MWRGRLANCRRDLARDRARWRRDPVAHAKQIARYLLARQGWSDQFWALDGINAPESSWIVCRHYPSQTNCNYNGPNAYGIPMAKPGSKMAIYGADWRTNPEAQLKWQILTYIPNRYGSPINAYRFRMANEWY
jgi:hypothetical protein